MVWNSENVYGYSINIGLSLEIALTMFLDHLQRMRQIRVELLYVFEALYKQVALGSVDPFGHWRI